MALTIAYYPLSFLSLISPGMIPFHFMLQQFLPCSFGVVEVFSPLHLFLFSVVFSYLHFLFPFVASLGCGISK